MPIVSHTMVSPASPPLPNPFNCELPLTTPISKKHYFVHMILTVSGQKLQKKALLENYRDIPITKCTCGSSENYWISIKCISVQQELAFKAAQMCRTFFFSYQVAEAYIQYMWQNEIWSNLIWNRNLPMMQLNLKNGNTHCGCRSSLPFSGLSRYLFKSYIFQLN